MSWKTKKALYEIHETSKKTNIIYCVMMTGEEVAAWCKSKNEFNGYVEGVGGDKSYSCWAVLRV